MKIAVAAINQETCSFNNVRTTLADFKATDFRTGAAVLDAPANAGVIGAFAAAMQQHELAPIVSAKALAGGALAADTYAGLKDMLLSGLQKAGKVDAVYLALHGAMEAEDEPDTEGDLLAATRQVVGPDCFIVVTLDHHANVTQKMVAASDVMVGYETQPHDLPGSGVKTARVMQDILDNKRRPAAALAKVPMLAPQDNFLTCGGPMKEWFDMAREIERDPAVIVASLFPTQPWLDVPDNGWSCLVYADDPATAQRYAKQLAQKAWDSREQFWQSERLSIPDAIKAANAEPCGLVVLSDAGDAAFGGAPGDNMSIAVEMLKHDLRGPALVPVVDPEAVAAAWAADIGREMTLPIGGQMSAGYSPCPKITGVVRAKLDACMADMTGGWGRRPMSRAVLFERGSLKLALMEKRGYAINHPILYQKLGLDVGQALMAVLKTGSNFQYFKQYQSRLIRVDSPGATQSDLTAFKWRHMIEPMYPFSKDVVFDVLAG